MKHYGLYDNSSTCFILGGMGFLYILTLGLCSFFIKQFVFDSIVATGTPDLSIIPLMAVFLIPTFIIIPLVSRKSRALSRYLLRCSFRKEGIYCFGFLWKPFLIPWESIRTYGLQGYSYTYASLVFLFFSTKKEYYKKESIAQISTNRIVFQLRNDIIPPLMEFMPLDIKVRLEEAIQTSTNIFIQRQMRHCQHS